MNLSAEISRLELGIAGLWSGGFGGHDNSRLLIRKANGAFSAILNAAGAVVEYGVDFVSDNRVDQWKKWDLVKDTSSVVLLLTPGRKRWYNGSGPFGYEFQNTVVAELSEDGTSLTGKIPDATHYTRSISMNRVR